MRAVEIDGQNGQGLCLGEGVVGFGFLDVFLSSEKPTTLTSKNRPFDHFAD